MQEKVKRVFWGGLQRVKEWNGNATRAVGQVLMFHQVENNRQKWMDEAFCVSFDTFQDCIQALQHPVFSVEEIEMHGFCGQYLTFDDGFVDTYENAWPLLSSNGLPFVVFITCDFIGKQGYLSCAQLKEMAKDPLCTIGAHSMSHPMFRFLPDDKALAEMIHSKKELEDMIGRDVTSWAYPYGSYYACGFGRRDLLLSAGYTRGFSTLNMPLVGTQSMDRMFLPRRNINEHNAREIMKRAE